MPAVDVDTHGSQTGSHIVLSGQGVAAGGMDFCAAGSQAQGQISRFGLHMDGHGDLFAGKGFLLFKPGADGGQGRHKILDPGDFHTAILGQGHISDDAHGTAPLQCFFLS